MDKITDSERNYKPVLQGRSLGTTNATGSRPALRSGTHRRVELDKLYDEFCRRKSVDL